MYYWDYLALKCGESDDDINDDDNNDKPELAVESKIQFSSITETTLNKKYC